MMFFKILQKHSQRTKRRNEILGFLNSNVRHFLPTYVLSMDDESFLPNRRLIDLSLASVRRASEIDLNQLSQRFPVDIRGKFMNVWPGEYYRLLAAIVQELKPELVIEIGTGTGASCLTMKEYLPRNGKIVTYDIITWHEFPGSGLKHSDFDLQLEQRVIDLTIKEKAISQYNLLQKADFIFVDGTKNGVMEKKLCELFDSVSFDKRVIVVFDDIKFINMLRIWREIRHPKLDLTSFSHWSGTGLVDWGGNHESHYNANRCGLLQNSSS